MGDPIIIIGPILEKVFFFFGALGFLVHSHIASSLELACREFGLKKKAKMKNNSPQKQAESGHRAAGLGLIARM